VPPSFSLKNGPSPGICPTPETPGPPARRLSVIVSGVNYITITRVDEQHAFLLVSSRAVLDYSETRASSSGILVVHRDLVVAALEVRIGGGGVDTEI